MPEQVTQVQKRRLFDCVTSQQGEESLSVQRISAEVGLPVGQPQDLLRGVSADCRLCPVMCKGGRWVDPSSPEGAFLHKKAAVFTAAGISHLCHGYSQDNIVWVGCQDERLSVVSDRDAGDGGGQGKQEAFSEVRNNVEKIAWSCDIHNIVL